MATIEQNLKEWKDNFQWKEQGDEWSEAWGTPENQWYGSIFVRIKNFVPADTILEIAPGYGRWTHFLAKSCQKLQLVDLSSNCIEYCKNRFSDYDHLEYYVNDGSSLKMIKSNSVNFVFSFDSLVHAEIDVIDAYIQEISRVLTTGGIAFIHHSNLGAYKHLVNKDKKGIVERLLTKIKVVPSHPAYWHWRASSVSAELVRKICNKYNLQCAIQETVNWGMRPEYLIDCFSVITRKSAIKGSFIFENINFMNEADNLKNIHSKYK